MNEHDTLPPGGMGPLDPTDIGPHKTGLRCPDWPDPVNPHVKSIVGCGSTNIEWDGEVWDCLDCGMFFTTEAGTPPSDVPA